MTMQVKNTNEVSLSGNTKNNFEISIEEDYKSVIILFTLRTVSLPNLSSPPQERAQVWLSLPKRHRLFHFSKSASSVATPIIWKGTDLSSFSLTCGVLYSTILTTYSATTPLNYTQQVQSGKKVMAPPLCQFQWEGVW